MGSETLPESIVITVHRFIHKCRVKAAVFSGSKLISNGLKHGNHEPRILQTKEERGHMTCSQFSVQKPASLMVWWGISDEGIGELYTRKGSIRIERLPSLWYYRCA